MPPNHRAHRRPATIPARSCTPPSYTPPASSIDSGASLPPSPVPDSTLAPALLSLLHWHHSTNSISSSTAGSDGRVLHRLQRRSASSTSLPPCHQVTPPHTLCYFLFKSAALEWNQPHLEWFLVVINCGFRFSFIVDNFAVNLTWNLKLEHHLPYNLKSAFGKDSLYEYETHKSTVFVLLWIWNSECKTIWQVDMNFCHVLNRN
jgi:hypothetical protein